MPRCPFVFTPHPGEDAPAFCEEDLRQCWLDAGHKRAHEKYPTDAQMVRAARRLHNYEGAHEIDGAKVSRADGESDGAYVESWVWVSYDEVEEEDREEE